MGINYEKGLRQALQLGALFSQAEPETLGEWDDVESTPDALAVVENEFGDRFTLVRFTVSAGIALAELREESGCTISVPVNVIGSEFKLVGVVWVGL